MQLDSPHLGWAWDTHAKVRGEALSPTDTKPLPGHSWEQLGNAGRGTTELKLPCSLFPPSTDRFVTVGAPPVSMETRESTTAPCWHFGYIDGKFSSCSCWGGRKDGSHLAMLFSEHLHQQKAEKRPQPETGGKQAEKPEEGMPGERGPLGVHRGGGKAQGGH